MTPVYLILISAIMVLALALYASRSR